MTSGRVGQMDRKSVVCWKCGESGHVRSHYPKLMAHEGLRDVNMAEEDDEDYYDSDEGILLMVDNHETVGDQKQKRKKGVPVVASDSEAHTVEKVGKGCKLKQVITKGIVSDLKTEVDSSRSCVPSKQKRVIF